MDYEKKYKEALNRAKHALDCDINGLVNTDKPLIFSMFPELKESDDERIREELISFFTERAKYTEDSTFNGLSSKEIIAWLEKQGEQRSDDIDNKFIRMRETKPANIAEFLDRLTTVEQEFLLEHIAKIRELDKEEQKPTDKVESKFKVGDTITDPTDSTFTFHINAIKDGKYMESDKDWILIKEADSDYELVEQKTIKWSEEDKNHIKSILSKIKCCKAQFPNSQAVVEAYNADIEWLKSLKDRYTWKPSEEQLAAVKEAACYGSVLSEKTIDNLVSLSKQLKKLMDE